MKEHGAVINARMGLNTWAAFTGNAGRRRHCGRRSDARSRSHFRLEVAAQKRFDVVAIHHHMTGDRPMVIFLHYWGRGPAEKLATGFKAALDQLGKTPSAD